MNHLHIRDYIQGGRTVRVEIDTQANVMLLDDVNYSHYKSGLNFRYDGGFYKTSPALIDVPHTGNWNVVIDLGGGSGTIRHSIEII